MLQRLYVSKVSENFIKSLGGEYLQPYVSMKSLADKHGCSPSTISNILYRGITEMILDGDTSEKIASKAIATTDNTVETYNRWQKALKLRKAYIMVKEYSVQIKTLRYKLDTFDESYIEEEGAATKEELESELTKLKASREELKNYIATVRGADNE